MKYFAYGSNMSIARIRDRVPGAEPLGCHVLREHDLRFHKSSKDGSGKCDAFFTEDQDHVIYGVLFEICSRQKKNLDKIEGLGYGYEEKRIEVVSSNSIQVEAVTYFATNIDQCLRPYTWYVNHVLVGAQEASLPIAYIEEKISIIGAVEDPDKERDFAQRAIHL